MLKDLNKEEEDYYFTKEDYDVFHKDLILDTSVDTNRSRKLVQDKLLKLNKLIIPQLVKNKFEIYNHYSSKNITSLPYCNEVANNNEVHWIGLRYGQDPKVVKEIDKNSPGIRQNPDYGFLQYQCFQINVVYEGIEVGIFHSIPRNSFDRGYVHENIDDPQFREKLINAVEKIQGYGIKWYASDSVFDFDTQKAEDFIDFYKRYDQYHTYSYGVVLIPRWNRLLQTENILTTCLDYIDLMYELFTVLRWKPNMLS